MILSGPEIHKEHLAGRIKIDPFDVGRINPNSYNFRLGRSYRTYTDFPLDPRRENPSAIVEIPAEGLVFLPDQLYLCSTEERLGSDFYAPTFSARSSIARLGVFINLSASLGDIGFFGQWTLQIVVVHPVRLYPGMNIGQMMFWQPHGEIDLYHGKYQSSHGPQSSQIHRDYVNSAGLSAR